MGEQVIQLVVVVVVLVLAYFGVTFWTRRIGKAGGANSGGSPAGPRRAAGPADDDFNEVLPAPRAGSNKGRFKLQGRDAEVAAKVLKRMLKPEEPS